MHQLLFPYDKIREYQDVLISKINDVVQENRNLIVHAPTGLGKTAASIAATLSNTLSTKKTVFFLTSMHTQHKIAVETIRDIKKKHDVKIVSVDIIGKKHLCLQPGVKLLNTKDFSEYCKAMREDRKCEFYNNLKKGETNSVNTKMALSDLKSTEEVGTEELMSISEKHKVCPYEISMILGKQSNIIITDYYYLFHPSIKESFLKKIGKELQDSVIIIDEAHNLPERIKHLASERLSNVILKRAIKEAEDFKHNDLVERLMKMLDALVTYKNKYEEEYITKKDFLDKAGLHDAQQAQAMLDELEILADKIREEQKTSFLGSVSQFLASWISDQAGFSRIFSKRQGFREEIISLNHNCMDPGVISEKVISEASSVIMMSGTLTPTHMYSEILGFDKGKTDELVLKSPFPEKNKLNLIIPKTTTKYSKRGSAQYEETGKIITEIVNTIPGNTAVFFPSYQLRDDVYKFMQGCKKTVFKELPGLDKQEKEELLSNFKLYKNSGAVLLGVISGSFGEGIDLPGDYLKGVIIVGLPLQKPDLETKSLIDYYDRKFGKGWDYGYVYPAFNKTLQSAGRCIRSETDRGVIIFLEERYAWPTYKRCFPETWDIKTTLLYKNMIQDFFENKSL